MLSTIMCRLFGFRARVPSAVHRSLVSGSNALRAQSHAHPDGWGLAWYEDGIARLARKATSAFDDDDFTRLGGFVSSNTVVAHVRKASVGALTVENTHPFTHAGWVFAHNGHLPGFTERSDEFEEPIALSLRSAMHGDTDSERVFALFLSALGRRRRDLSAQDVAFGEVEDALVDVLEHLERCCAQASEAPAFNLIATNGRLLVAYRQGRPLHFSTHKRTCPERATCPAFAGRCESPSLPGAEVSHLVVSSEPTGDEDVWTELADGEFVGVDAGMRFYRSSCGTLRADTRPVTRGGLTG